MDQGHELDIERRLTETEARSRSNTKRLDELKETVDAINRVALSVEKMAVKQDVMNENLGRLTDDVDALKAEPGKRWKFVIEKAIYFVVAAVVGFFLAKVGLG